MASLAIKKRLFVVGCPRSGTTLLQSLLSAHSEIVSFPETHFFDESPARPLLSFFGLASRSWRRRFHEFIAAVGRTDLRGYLPWRGIFARNYHRRMIRLLDHLTLEQGASIWLEKTPGHLRSIPLITTVVPGAKFIHIIRAGRDVVASLHEVSHQHPDAWGGAWSIDKCVDWWNHAIELSAGYCGEEGHHFVHYDDLVNSPERVLRQICDFVGVSFEPSMLEPSEEDRRAIIGSDEPWKRRTLESPVDSRPSGKFVRLFSSDQQRAILDRLVDDTVFGRTECKGTGMGAG